MFGHIKTLENPLYQQKTTKERKIYEVSWPGRNSFYEVSRPGWNSLNVHFGKTHFKDLNIKARIFFKHQAQLFYFLRFFYYGSQNGPTTQ